MPVEGERVARDFYCSLLGFLEEPAPTGEVSFRSPKTRIRLRAEAEFSPASGVLGTVFVRNVRGLSQRLQAAGFDPVAPASAADRLWVADPFGNRIELTRLAPFPTDGIVFSTRIPRVVMSLAGGLFIGYGLGEMTHGRIDASGGWPLGWGIGLALAANQLRHRT